MGGNGIFRKQFLLTLVIVALVAVGCAGKTPAAGGQKADSLSRLKKIDIKDTDKSTIVILVMDTPVTFTSVKVSNPPKMVIDMAGADLGSFNKLMEVGKGPVKYVQPLEMPASRRIARIEIGLTSDVRSKMVQNDSIINIVFEKPEPQAASATIQNPSDAKATDNPVTADTKDTARKVEIKPLPQADTKVADSTPADTRPAEDSAVIPKDKLAKNVKDISWTKEGDAYVVKVDADGAFDKEEDFKLGTDRLVVDLPGVSAVKDKINLDVNGSLLKKVRMARHMDFPAKVRIVFDLGGPTRYDVKKTGSGLVVRIIPADSKTLDAKPAASERKAVTASVVTPEKKPIEMKAVPAQSQKADRKPAKVEAEPKRKPSGINVYVTKTDGKSMISSTPIDDTSESAGSVRARNFVETDTKIYTGGLISFDIQNAELDKVIKLLADVAGLNLIMDPTDVRGSVTLKLDNVPWDQALDILLKLYNLDKRIENNVMRVAGKAKLDDEQKRDLQLVDDLNKLKRRTEELETKTFKINYSTATDLEQKVKKVLSERGDATANPRTNELIITDIEANLRKAGELIKILDKEVYQIMIEARIVSVSTTYSRSLGLAWGLTRDRSATNPNEPSIGMAYGAGRVDGGANNKYKLTTPVGDIVTKGGLGALGLSWLNVGSGLNLDVTINALESIGKAETLAAPKILTMENQAATISSGRTIYVQATSATGTKPEPLSSTLSLTVTPQVTGDNFITLLVNANDNSPDPLGAPVGATASINTKTISTKVMVKNGDTIVLGGIYTKRGDGDKVDQVPILGNIPVIGWLFKTKTKGEDVFELLVFITPKLIPSIGPKINADI